MENVILSDEQEKLAALLAKVPELLFFSQDKECKTMFESLAKFARKAKQRESQQKNNTQRFREMDLEVLISLVDDDDNAKPDAIRLYQLPKKVNMVESPNRHPSTRKKRKKKPSSRKEYEKVTWDSQEVKQ